MHSRGKLSRIAAAVAAAMVLLSVPLLAATAEAAPATAPAAEQAVAAGHAGAGQAAAAVARRVKPKVRWAVRHDATPPLRTMKRIPPKASKKVRPSHTTPRRKGGALSRAHVSKRSRSKASKSASFTPKDVQTSNPLNDMPQFGQNFDGISGGGASGAVGANDYVQTAGGNFAVYSKQGALLYGPVAQTTLWQGFSGQCASFFGYRFSVQYDEQAGRWFTSGLYSVGGDGTYECITVSQTGDPTGSWYRYEYHLTAGEVFVSGQSFGIWPDAYYMSGVDNAENAGIVYAFDRAQMLAGQPAQDVSFTLSNQYANVQPTGAEGAALGASPPAGAPDPFFMSCFSSGVPNHQGCDQLDEWDFHVDWTTPANSAFGNNLAPSQTLTVDPFDSNLCDYDPNCIPQPGTTTGLSPASGALTNPGVYRNLGGAQTIVLDQTVNASPDTSTGNQAGIRWYELTGTGSGWTVGQQGTYAPDAASRWLGGANIDAAGDMAIGYPVSSSSIYPSLRVAGRLAGDPAGQLTQGETTMMAGSGTMGGFGNPGVEASSMQVDPADGCTFWFTGDYATSSGAQNTRIGSFTFPNCTTGPRGQISGLVTDAGTGEPVAGAQVATSLGTTMTDGQGRYSFVLPTGSYDLNASAWDHTGKTISGAQVSNGATTTENFSLTPVPTVTVTGTVTDGSGHGYPLYAGIDFAGLPGGPVMTNPATGRYTVSLPENQTFKPTVTATLPGYQAATPVITTGTASLTQNLRLQVDAPTCTAPGYQFAYGTPALNETFDDYSGAGGTTPPPGWNVVDNSGSGRVWSFNGPGGLSNQTGGSGFFAGANDGQYADYTTEDTSLISPVFDLSADTYPVVRFNTNLGGTYGNQTSSVDVSTDGGQTWTTVWQQSGLQSINGPDLEQVPIPQAAGQSSVQIRFHFVSRNGNAWEVDNVSVANRACAPVPGGLMVGKVSDANTGAGISGTAVTLTDQAALNETFDDYTGDGGTTPPPGWMIQDNQGNGEVWTFNNPQGFGSGNTTGGTGRFATVNSYTFPAADSQDTSLISPVFSLSGDSDPVLSFNNDFLNDNNSTAEVDLSTDGGHTWTSIWQQSSNVSGLEQVPIPQAAGQSDVRIRFHYTGSTFVCCGGALTFAGWWKVDNVTVARAAVQVTTTSAPLTQGPILPVGYYQFFDPLTGSHSFTAAPPGYVTATHTVNVTANTTTEADFSLAAPRLSLSTSDIQSSQVLGHTTTAKLTIKNTGTAPASLGVAQPNGVSQSLTQSQRLFALGARNLARLGAPLRRVRPAQGLSIVAPPAADRSRATTAGSAGAAMAPRAAASGGLAWSPVASYPTTVEDNATASGDGMIYSVGGYTGLPGGTIEALDTAYAYNTRLGAWTQLRHMPQVLDKPSAAFVNGKLYVSGGSGAANDGFPTAATYAYDPQTDTWSALADNPYPAVAPGVATVGSTIYFVGGCRDYVLACGATPTVAAYNTATGTWSTAAPYPHPVAWESCGAINGKIYCAGGANDTGYDADGYVYDPSANKWSPIAAMPTSVWGSAYDAASGRLVITGGVFGGGISNQGLAYDPATNSWTALPNNYYTLYRTGGACGFYQIGGDPGGFSPQAVTDQLPGLNGCAGAGLPWLKLSGGTTATLAPGQSITVKVTLAATTAATITQPGTYTAQLPIENNTPYTVRPVNVTMSVTPPHGWGKVTGTVTGTTCQGVTGPVAGAQVQAVGKKYTIAVTTGQNGGYTLWAPSSSDPYKLAVSSNGWATKIVTASIQAGGTITANVTLSPIC